jgi:hypothetical protein
MKSLFNLIFLLVLTQAQAQSIVAGEFDGNDFYHNYAPELVLSAPDPVNISSDSIFIDMNNDGIVDVIIDVFNQNGGNWFDKRHAEIIPINNSEIALGAIDTCFANCPPPDLVSFEALAHAFDQPDLIDGASNWIDSAAYLSFNKWEAAVPNNCGYGCSGGDFQLDYRYVGIRIISGSDTLYGWIRTRLYSTAMGDYDISIGSFACNQYAVGIEELGLPKKRIIRTFDVLGRTSETKPNTLLIHQYSDGTTDKVFLFE